MESSDFLEKLKTRLEPFETENLINTIQTVTVDDILNSPVLILTVLFILFFGVYKKSKPILLTVFSVFSMSLMVKYAMPPSGQELTVSSILPFIGGGLGIGSIIVYFIFVKQ